jgi:hypothetical protein
MSQSSSVVGNHFLNAVGSRPAGTYHFFAIGFQRAPKDFTMSLLRNGTSKNMTLLTFHQLLDLWRQIDVVMKFRNDLARNVELSHGMPFGLFAKLIYPKLNNQTFNVNPKVNFNDVISVDIFEK